MSLVGKWCWSCCFDWQYWTFGSGSPLYDFPSCAVAGRWFVSVHCGREKGDNYQVYDHILVEECSACFVRNIHLFFLSFLGGNFPTALGFEGFLLK